MPQLRAIPTSHLNQLQKVFKAARLRTTSITFGITSLLENINTEEKNSVAIYVDESVVEMKIMLGGGVAALRSIEDTSQVNMEEREFDSTSIANQIRISLGQLPISSRNLIHSVRIFGLPSLVEDLKDAIQSAVERMGMTVETGTIHANKQIIDPEDTGDLYQPALYTAVKGLFDQKYDFEFSIPQTSRLKQITAVISSQRIAWAGGGSIGLILVTIIAFTLQYWKLSDLETRWNTIRPQVTELDNIQQQIRKFQPWFDTSVPSLEIMKTLAESFPEEGSVWIKTIGIKDLSSVTCTGFARNNMEWLKLQDQLGKNKSIGDMHVLQTKGDAVIQFAFTFQWKGISNGS